LARLKRLFVMGDLLEAEYRMERDRLRAQLLALTPPAMHDLEGAAEILQDFERIWEAATPKERRQIVYTLLETVYLDADRGPVVAIEPKAEFAPLFETMAAGEGEQSEIVDTIVILAPGAVLATI
jgi:hypothetical protein